MIKFKVPDVVDIAVDKNDYAINIVPSYTFRFQKDNDIIGELDFNDSMLKFEGNADKSAEAFIDSISIIWAERLKQERISAVKDYEKEIANGIRVYAFLDGGRYEAMELVQERELKHNATLILDKE